MRNKYTLREGRYNHSLLKQRRKNNKVTDPKLISQVYFQGNGRRIEELTPFQTITLFLAINASITLNLQKANHPRKNIDSKSMSANTHNTIKQSAAIQTPENNLPLISSSVFFRGIPAKTITLKTNNCIVKTQGSTPGKICYLDGKKNFLKVADPSNNDALQGKYNLILSQENIGINVPNTNFYFEENGIVIWQNKIIIDNWWYIGSEYVPNLTNPFHFINKLLVIYPEFDETIFAHFRNEIVKNSGENSIAKLAVAGTFFKDLANNSGNWGFNKHGLVIIDVDYPVPSTVYEYLMLAAHTQRHLKESGILLSPNNLKDMIFIYEDMLSKTPPKFHPAVDMPIAQYLALIINYLDACLQTQKIIENKSPKMAPDHPTQLVNDLLFDAFKRVNEQPYTSSDEHLQNRLDMELIETAIRFPAKMDLLVEKLFIELPEYQRLIKNFDILLWVCKRNSRLTDKLMTPLINSKNEFRRLIPSLEILVTAIEELPHYSDSLMKYIVIDLAEFKRLVLNEYHFLVLLHKFPNYASNFVQHVVDNHSEFVRLVTSPNMLISMVKTIPQYVDRVVWYIVANPSKCKQLIETPFGQYVLSEYFPKFYQLLSKNLMIGELYERKKLLRWFKNDDSQKKESISEHQSENKAFLK